MSVGANDLEEEFFAVEGRPAIPFPVVDYGPVIRDLELRHAALTTAIEFLDAGVLSERSRLQVEELRELISNALVVLQMLRSVQQQRGTKSQ